MIRVHTMASAPLLSALHQSAFADGWSEAACADILAMPGTHCWIAERDEKPCGFLVIRLAADEGEVITTGCIPSVRRSGVATRLFETAAHDLTGCERLFLEVSTANEAAQAFYRGLGFQQAGVRRGYYADGTNALVLVRE